jgi:hypothetical protein
MTDATVPAGDAPVPSQPLALHVNNFGAWVKEAALLKQLTDAGG